MLAGEFYLAEQLAGIVAGGDAFFAGHAEIIHRNSHLHLALQLHYGEKSYRSQHNLLAAAHGKVAVEAAANALRNGVFASVAYALPANIGAQQDGLGALDDRLGYVAHRL